MHVVVCKPVDAHVGAIVVVFFSSWPSALCPASWEIISLQTVHVVIRDPFSVQVGAIV